MSPAAIQLYERALQESVQAHVHFEDGSQTPLLISRFLGVADADDRTLLSGVTGPVLDVGCGPGRHLHALKLLGVEALGVDVSPVAVELARRGGAQAVLGDVFGDALTPGSWATALLLDGNIGIGGRPALLLHRLRSLLVPGGCVLAELEAPSIDSRASRARIESAGQASGWFPWARVSVSEVDRLAAAAQLTVEERWRCGERWFARLRCS